MKEGKARTSFGCILVLCTFASFFLLTLVVDLRVLLLESSHYFGVAQTTISWLLFTYYAVSTVSLIAVGFLATFLGRRLLLVLLNVGSLLGVALNLASSYQRSTSLLFVARAIMGLCIESIHPLLEETISDYAGNNQSFGLNFKTIMDTLGGSLGVVGISLMYSISHSMIEPSWLIVGFAFLHTLLIVALVFVDNARDIGVRQRPRFSAVCSLGISQLLTTLSTGIACGTLTAFYFFMTSYLALREQWSNQVCSYTYALEGGLLCIVSIGVSRLVDYYRRIGIFILASHILLSLSYFGLYYSPNCTRCGVAFVALTLFVLAITVIYPSAYAAISLQSPYHLKSFSFGLFRAFLVISMKSMIILGGYLQAADYSKTSDGFSRMLIAYALVQVASMGIFLAAAACDYTTEGLLFIKESDEMDLMPIA